MSGGKTVTSEGSREAHAANRRAFRLDLSARQWTAHDAPEAAPPPLDIDWPSEWEPLQSKEDARLHADAVARSVPPDHPLFVRDYVALGTSWQATLLRSLEDADLLIVVEGPNFTGREETPPRFETFRGLADWLKAAKVRSGLWWP